MSALIRRRLACTLVALILATGLVGCSSPDDNGAGGNGGASSGEATTGETTNGEATTGASPGESLARTKCTMCHSYDRVEQADKDRAGWEQTIDRMVENGLVVSAEEREQITDYLVERDQ